MSAHGAHRATGPNPQKQDSLFTVEDLGVEERLPLSIPGRPSHTGETFDGPGFTGSRAGFSELPSQSGRKVASLEIHEGFLLPGSKSSAPVSSAPVFVHPIPLWRRRWMVVIFSLTASLLFADQNLLAPNLSMAAKSFNFDGDQRDSLLGGVIMAAFFLTGAPAALVVGWLTDKVNRRNLLFIVVVLGEAPCLATYWVTEYWQFFLLRTLTGISVGGCFPLMFSLLGDLFPITQRSIVSALVGISTGAGVAVGQALAGWVGPATGNWRLPFVVVALPSLVVALIMLLTCPEPPRGGFEEALRDRYADGAEYTETITWPKVKALFRIRSNQLIIGQGLFGSLPWGMMLTFFNDYLAADPPSGKGLGVAAATGIILVFGVSGGIGVIGGGYGGQWLYNRKKEYLPIVMMVGVFGGMWPLYYLINAPLASLPLGPAFLMALLSGSMSGVAGPNLHAVMLNVNEPETRGVAMALQSMTDDVGKGLGPVFVAIFIRALGRRTAFNLAVAGWLPCAVMLGSLYWCIREDEDDMQARLAARSAAGAPGEGLLALGGPAAGEGGKARLLHPTMMPSDGPIFDMERDGGGNPTDRRPATSLFGFGAVRQTPLLLPQAGGDSHLHAPQQAEWPSELSHTHVWRAPSLTSTAAPFGGSPGGGGGGGGGVGAASLSPSMTQWSPGHHALSLGSLGSDGASSPVVAYPLLRRHFEGADAQQQQQEVWAPSAGHGEEEDAGVPLVGAQQSQPPRGGGRAAAGYSSAAFGEEDEGGNGGGGTPSSRAAADGQGAWAKISDADDGDGQGAWVTTGEEAEVQEEEEEEAQFSGGGNGGPQASAGDAAHSALGGMHGGVSWAGRVPQSGHSPRPGEGVQEARLMDVDGSA